MTSIALQLELLQLEIAKTCANRQNFNHKVDLLAVSKHHSADKIRQAQQNGHRLFAENYVQEALDKIQELSDLDICWHMIGAIQSRKCAQIAQNFDWVQSVDREKIVQKLSQARPHHLAPLNICIQVNLFAEEQKAGVDELETQRLAKLIEQLPNLRLRGIMALPPKQTDEKIQKQQFEKISALYQQLSQLYPSVDTLSMGMSGDFRQAIASGSSMVRLGTAVFGSRD